MQFELEQAHKLESVGQLAAGIAHEINTPAQYLGDNTRFLKEAFGDLRVALDGFERLLQAAKAGAVDAQVLAEAETTLQQAEVEYLATEVPKAIDQSLKGIEQVTTIVAAMKQFSHPGDDQKSLVNLQAAIETTITVARNEWKFVAEMVTDFDPDLPDVTCRPGEMNQVFVNLIVNAAQAVGETLDEVGTDRGTIIVGTRRAGEWAEIFVRDTGPGIPDDVRARIFDPFFTTKAVGKGTGQGLAIVRSMVVDKHGGTIDCKTERGQGTTFTVRIPISPKGETTSSCCLVNVGDPPALPGRPSVFDVSGSNVRNSPREPLKHHAGESSMNNYRSLNHTKWECQYHVVFIPKYRRKTLYGGLRHYLGDVLRRLAEHSGRVGWRKGICWRITSTCWCRFRRNTRLRR